MLIVSVYLCSGQHRPFKVRAKTSLDGLNEVLLAAEKHYPALFEEKSGDNDKRYITNSGKVVKEYGYPKTISAVTTGRG